MISKLERFQALLAMDTNYMPPEYGKDIFQYTSPISFAAILFGKADRPTLWLAAALALAVVPECLDSIWNMGSSRCDTVRDEDKLKDE